VGGVEVYFTVNVALKDGGDPFGRVNILQPVVISPRAIDAHAFCQPRLNGIRGEFTQDSKNGRNVELGLLCDPGAKDFRIGTTRIDATCVVLHCQHN